MNNIVTFDGRRNRLPWGSDPQVLLLRRYINERLRKGGIVSARVCGGWLSRREPDMPAAAVQRIVRGAFATLRPRRVVPR